MRPKGNRRNKSIEPPNKVAIATGNMRAALRILDPISNVNKLAGYNRSERPFFLVDAL